MPPLVCGWGHAQEQGAVSGGLACIAGAILLAGVLPGFRRYRRPNEVESLPAAGVTTDSPPQPDDTGAVP